jgi:hypothetical protein
LTGNVRASLVKNVDRAMIVMCIEEF